MSRWLSIFFILARGERVIVYSNEDDGYVITWNRSLTLQVWYRSNQSFKWGGTSIPLDAWEEVSIRTLSSEPRSYDDAAQKAMTWVADGWSDDR